MTYWIFVLATALISGLFFYTAIRKAAFPFTAFQVFGVVQTVMLFGYALSRFGLLLEQRLKNGFWAARSEWLSPQFHWYGALLGVAIVWLCLVFIGSKNRKSVQVFFGVLAQTACIIFFFGKVGCFADGHAGCIGGPTQLPWGVSYSWGDAASSIPLHPAQLYSALGAFMLFLILYFRVGVLWSTTIFFILHSLTEFGLEFLKPMPRLFFGSLSLAHVTYMAVFIAGVAGALVMVFQNNDLTRLLHFKRLSSYLSVLMKTVL
jgi:prolipoprotein diacylglyceryltransferase